ncbi:MAG: DUF4386 domain-containing protein [Candidatus Pacearchaeota archaeon]|jgi:hypothetical protein
MKKYITNKSRAILVGIFIILAYGVLASLITKSKIIIMIADVFSGLAVMGIAVLMYPLFKQFNKNLSISYLILKYLEGILMILAGLLFLNPSLQYLKDIIYNNFHIYVFIISGFMFYYLLYKSKLVPKFISIWGALGIFTLLVSTLFNLADIHYIIIDYLLALIITNEVFLAIWLIFKGFNKNK